MQLTIDTNSDSYENALTVLNAAYGNCETVHTPPVHQTDTKESKTNKGNSGKKKQEKQAPAPTYEDLVTLLGGVNSNHGFAAAMDLVNKFDVNKLSDLPKEKYAEFAKEAKALLK